MSIKSYYLLGERVFGYFDSHSLIKRAANSSSEVCAHPTECAPSPPALVGLPTSGSRAPPP